MPVAPDARLSLFEHLDELRKRLVWCLVVLVLGVIVAAVFNGFVFEVLLWPLKQVSGLPRSAYQITTFSPAEPFMVSLKVWVVAGLIMASPFLIWQLWAFVGPAFTSTQKRYFYPVVAACSLLFLGGDHRIEVALLRRGERRSHECPELPDEERRGHDEAGHHPDLEAHHERFRRAEGGDLVGRPGQAGYLLERPQQHFEDEAVEDGRDDHAQDEDDETPDEPLAQLVEVLEERKPRVGSDGHGGSGGAGPAGGRGRRLLRRRFGLVLRSGGRFERRGGDRTGVLPRVFPVLIVVGERERAFDVLARFAELAHAPPQRARVPQSERGHQRL